MDNRTFFKKVREENKMSLADIFSDIRRKHTKEETDRVFIAGTELTTPSEAEMLAGWTKPFLFFKFFLICLIGFLVLYVVSSMTGTTYYLMIVGIPFMIPITFLLLIWEMHIPRNISLVEVIWMTAVGGVLSICATLMLQVIGFEIPDAVFAGLLEEPAKLLLIYYFLKKKNYRYALDGVMIGASVGAGFAMFESMQYATRFMLEYGIRFGDLFIGLQAGLEVALVRAITGIAGHGMWAALYGGALVFVKGREPIAFKHLKEMEFLKYFILSIALHAFHNSSISISEFLGIEVKIVGIYVLDTVIEVVLNVAIFLPMLTKGVNQIVEISAALNGGRVTKAVYRGTSGQGVQMRSASTAVFYIEGAAGAAIGQRYTLMEGQSKTIGRVPDRNDIAFPNSRDISGRHCMLTVKGGRIYVQDLGSTNGTYIGERKLPSQQLVPIAEGQCFYMGNRTCGFRIRSGS